MQKGKRASKLLYKSEFHSLYEAVCEAQTILDDVRILADTGKCLRVIRRYK